jgi:transcriptional regulator with XRE-family HTH domain
MAIIQAVPRLKGILQERGMTQEQLAELADIPQGSISRFDNNQSHKADHLFSIAHALGVKVEDLFHQTKKE